MCEHIYRGGPHLQGPFATAAELLAAVEAGEVDPCTADWGSASQDLSWAATRPRDPPSGGPTGPGAKASPRVAAPQPAPRVTLRFAAASQLHLSLAEPLPRECGGGS